METLRSLTFGGLVGAGIGALMYLQYSSFLVYLGPYWFIGGCAGLGTAIQQAIERTLHFIFKPTFRVITFHEKLQELDQLREQRRINTTTYEHLIKSLCEKRYLE
jgi:hypothetical protein